jgi:hypothetical protein
MVERSTRSASEVLRRLLIVPIAKCLDFLLYIQHHAR